MNTTQTTPEPLTAADFEVQWDEHKTFPFFESEDGRIFGYGHPDKEWAAAQVKAYYDHTDPDAADDHVVEASDVRYIWSVRVGDGDDDEIRFTYGDAEGPHTEDTPGAAPTWTVAL